MNIQPNPAYNSLKGAGLMTELQEKTGVICVKNADGVLIPLRSLVTLQEDEPSDFCILDAYFVQCRRETVIPTDLVFKEEPGVTWCEYKEHIWKDGQEYRVLHYTHEDVDTHRLKAIGTVLKPVLSPEEYARRQERIAEAAARLFRSIEDRKARLADGTTQQGSEAI